MLFRHGADTDKRTTGRSRESSEAQLKELRAKARRRLIGALALVLAAVIVVPWFFQEPVTDDTHAPVVIPAAPGGLPPATSPSATDSHPDALAQADNPQADAAAAGQDGAQPTNPDATAGVVTTPSQPAPAQPPAVASAAPETAPAPPETRPAAKPTPPPRTAAPEKPTKKPTERTDDGSVALALLAGKTPAPSAAAKPAAGQGRYYLQVAAYTTEQDAQSRRDSLRQAGVTDAYVERGQSSGRTVYRLRVGPFGSHEAAQAAQARLRALGYQNGLISGN